MRELVEYFEDREGTAYGNFKKDFKKRTVGGQELISHMAFKSPDGGLLNISACWEVLFKPGPKIEKKVMDAHLEKVRQYGLARLKVKGVRASQVAEEVFEMMLEDPIIRQMIAKAMMKENKTKKELEKLLHCLQF